MAQRLTTHMDIVAKYMGLIVPIANGALMETLADSYLAGTGIDQFAIDTKRRVLDAGAIAIG